MHGPKSKSKSKPKKSRGISLAGQLLQIVIASGRSAGQLGRDADVDESQIRRWINGERDLRLQSAARLADALGVEPLRVSRRSRASSSTPRPSRSSTAAEGPLPDRLDELEPDPDAVGQ